MVSQLKGKIKLKFDLRNYLFVTIKKPNVWKYVDETRLITLARRALRSFVTKLRAVRPRHTILIGEAEVNEAN